MGLKFQLARPPVPGTTRTPCPLLPLPPRVGQNSAPTSGQSTDGGGEGLRCDVSWVVPLKACCTERHVLAELWPGAAGRKGRRPGPRLPLSTPAAPSLAVGFREVTAVYVPDTCALSHTLIDFTRRHSAAIPESPTTRKQLGGGWRSSPSSGPADAGTRRVNEECWPWVFGRCPRGRWERCGVSTRTLAPKPAPPESSLSWRCPPQPHSTRVRPLAESRCLAPTQPPRLRQ